VSDREILANAIDKAKANGFIIVWKVNEIDIKDDYAYVVEVLFSHSFAQAFWGKEDYIINERGMIAVDNYGVEFAWQYYLQQMVLEKNPIKYLKEFL